MNRIVVYTSKTGFTEKYAKWIAEELQCEAVSLKKADISTLKNYDLVIYGGGIMANMVSGYDKIKKLNLRNVIVFSSGISVQADGVRENIAKQNGIPVDKLYYFEGGYEPSKVGFIGRMIIKMISASLKKKEEKTPEDLHMLETIKGADNTNRDAINELVQAAIKTGSI